MSRSIACPLVGSYFRPPAPSLLRCLPAGTELTLTREPENQYDRHAIALYVKSAQIPESQHATLESAVSSQGFELQEVLSQESWHLGYLPKTVAATLTTAVLPEVAKLGFDPAGKPQVFFSTGEGQ